VDRAPSFRKMQSVLDPYGRCAIRNALSGIALACLSVAVGCGTGGPTPPPPPPVKAFSNASLTGSYAYTLGGSDLSPVGGTPYVRSGAFVADGNGNITSGEDDFVQADSLTTTKITGSYAVASDGTGMLTLILGEEQLNLAITMGTVSQVDMIEFDATATGAGQAVQQDTSALSSTPTGTYVFRLHSYQPGVPSTGSVSAVGNMIMSGGVIDGNEDVVRFGTLNSVTITGALTAPDSNGRGTATLTDSTGLTTNYVFYVVDANTLNFLETDPGPLGTGIADAQSGAPFSNLNLNNGFAFRSRGDTQTHLDGVNSVGAFASDGNGNITSGSYDAGQDGVPTLNASLTGTYSVDTSGRVTITLNPTLNSQTLSPIQEVAWMVSSSRALFLVDVPGIAEDGEMDQQQGGPFSSSSLNGAYAFEMFGYDSQSPVEVDRVGSMTLSGSSTLNLTNYFVNRTGSRAQTNAAGTYAVSANGRVSGSVNGVTNDLVLYLTSGSSGFLLLGDTGAEVSGSITQQVVP
jgi:hypothetical protein